MIGDLALTAPTGSCFALGPIYRLGQVEEKGMVLLCAAGIARYNVQLTLLYSNSLMISPLSTKGNACECM